MKFTEFLLFKESGYFTLEPEDMIASGREAEVFNTSDPDIVVRVARRKRRKQGCEKILARPDIQATGGVVIIYGTKNVEGKNYTYKEKVSLNWDRFLHSIYPANYANEIIDNLLSLKDFDLPQDQEHFDKAKRFLRNVPETENLVGAIEAGVPIVDLYSVNLGVNRNNHIVILDC